MHMSPNTIKSIIDACQENDTNINKKSWTSLNALKTIINKDHGEDSLFYEWFRSTEKMDVMLSNSWNQYVLSMVGARTVRIDAQNAKIEHDPKTIYEIFGDIDIKEYSLIMRSVALFVLSETLSVSTTTIAGFGNQIDCIAKKVFPNDHENEKESVRALVILDRLIYSLENKRRASETTGIVIKTVKLRFSGNQDILSLLFLLYAIRGKTAADNDAGLMEMRTEIEDLRETEKQRLGEIEDRANIKVIELGGFLIAVFSIIGINVFSANLRTWEELKKINISLVSALAVLFIFMWLITLWGRRAGRRVGRRRGEGRLKSRRKDKL